MLLKHAQARSKYDTRAADYDREWQRYEAETLSRAADAIGDLASSVILDAPCGTAELARWLLRRSPDIRISCVDASAAMLRVAREKWRGEPRVGLQQAVVEALPFRDGVFDWVVCCSALHYFKHPGAVLREFRRVLKPGGRLLLMDWCRDAWHCRLVNRWKRWTDASHVRMHTTSELHELILQAGLAMPQVERFRIAWLAKMRLWDMMSCVASSEGPR